MTVAPAGHLDTTGEAHVADVLAAIEERGLVTVVAGFLIGSAALGGFDPERSDIDVVAVVDRAFERGARDDVVEAIGRLRCPARALELVIYVKGSQPPDFELNVTATVEGAREQPDEPRHWFVIDAAIGQEHAVAFGGAEWSTFFAPIPEQRLREALHEAIAWSERQPLENEFARVNAIRARHYLDHGEWMSKPDASR
jgi:Nucleotidyltransferase domain